MKIKDVVLNKKTLSPAQLAKLHNVSIDAIKAQVDKGIKVEKEHTSSVGLAREIALDHIKEFPDYYDRLEKVEK